MPKDTLLLGKVSSFRKKLLVLMRHWTKYISTMDPSTAVFDPMDEVITLSLVLSLNAVAVSFYTDTGKL